LNSVLQIIKVTHEESESTFLLMAPKRSESLFEVIY
jgi:hypothetical protein